ncbi:MAG: hypothetical protein HFE63_07760 [Clostridiales bacterium]|nr:hypothetical protein [Clostridiales bacterium]
MIFSKSEWIWHNDYRGVNVYVNFEDSFKLDSKPEKCLMRISCDRNYSLYINGKFVDCGQYSDYEDLKFYDELDISEFVNVGENKLFITVYYQNKSCSTYRHGEPGLIFEIIADDMPICVSSSKTITYKNSAFADGEMEMVSGQFGYTFHYDCSREAERIGEKCADIVNKTRDIKPRPIKKLTISEPADAALINTGSFTDTIVSGTPAQKMLAASLTNYSGHSKQLPSDGIKLAVNDNEKSKCSGIMAIIDLGAESTGFLSLDIDVANECDIYIGWGEHLTDLRVRTSIGGRNFAASYHAKAGRNHFENPLLRCGCRYIQLHVYANECTLYYAGIRPTMYPIDKIVPFSCADQLHNRIYNTSLRTLHLCMHEHYEDCPWREQALYSMDSRNQMLCGYYAFGETRFARASLELMAHSLRDDNMLELCSPAEVTITIPCFSAVFMTQLYEYLLFSGDKDFVRRILPTAEAISKEFISRIEANGLIKCFGETKYWNFYEWQSGLEGSISGDVPEDERTYDAPLCAFVSFGLRSLADTLKQLGENEKAEYYNNQHLELNRSIDANFYDEVRGCYASFIKKGEKFHYSELTNSLIVYADAVPENRLESVLATIAGGELLEVTLSHSIFKYDALMRNKQKYGKYVFENIAKHWGHMLENNATTFWETIEGEKDFANAGSLCHGWSAIPVYIYFKYALNMSPDLTGIYNARID